MILRNRLIIMSICTTESCSYLMKSPFPQAGNLQSAPKEANVEINIDEIDFFKGREYIHALINREQGAGFYCLSEISPENCELDHVISQLNGGDNSYKNIVAACHKCNTRKQGSTADDFLRNLYRKGMSSEREFEGRLSVLKALSRGGLKPGL